MTIQTTDTFLVEVETAVAGVYVPVYELHTLSLTVTEAKKTFAVFQRATKHQIYDIPEYDYSVQGYLDPADPGQIRLRLIATSRIVGRVRITTDGTNGFTQTVRVGTRKLDANADGGLDGISFDFAGQDDPVIAGSGPLP